MKAVKGTLCLALAVAAGGALAEKSVVPDAEETPSFTISADPTVAVLQLAFWGGNLGNRLAYALYGDGRLVRIMHRGTEILEHEVHLSFDESMELVAIAVRHGLVETSTAELFQRMEDIDRRRREATGKPEMGPFAGPPIEGGSERLEIRLESLGTGGPRQTVLLGPGIFPRKPDHEIRELRGWDLLVREIRTLFPREKW
jgi:hypothetical protein